jgi:hypothetical protein
VVVTPDQCLHAIDLEWRFVEAQPSTVVERGLLLVAEKLATEAWLGAAPESTVRELACWLGVLLGKDSSFVDRAVEREARFQALQRCGGILVESVLRAEEHKVHTAWLNRLNELVPVR